MHDAVDISRKIPEAVRVAELGPADVAGDYIDTAEIEKVVRAVILGTFL
jgi:hypothetical protein